MLKIYGESPSQAVMKIYNLHKWESWKFQRVPKGLWNDTSEVEKFLEWVEKQLQLKKLSDWQTVTTKQFCDVGGATILQNYGTISNILNQFKAGNTLEEFN